ncbi:MAG: dihydrolipoyl dehydrogenase [Myxococcota bacterium]
MAKTSYEAIVIGGGPGGYVAAIRCRQLGLETLCVEREYMGGVCLNWGCIPSKALISAAGLVEKIRTADEMGITVGDVKVDVGKMQEWKGGIVKKLTGGVRSLVKGNGADIVMGHARFTGKNSIEVEGSDGKKQSFTATKGIIIATGAQTIRIPGFDLDGKVVMGAREAVSLDRAPKKMVLIGGGVIGLELGMVYQKLGAELTIVEMMDQLLPGTDKDMVKVVEKKLKKGGANILLGARAKGCEVKGDSAVVTVDHGGEEKKFEADTVLVAVGFTPNSSELGLDRAGVKTDERGHILVDDKFQTNVPGVYAIGDVCGAPYLAHKASKEGEVAAEVIAGHKSERDWLGMPAAIFTDPEIATVGLTETQAKEQGRNVKVGKFPFAASGRAMSVRHTEGFIKTVIDAEDNRLLGVGIVGPEASELIGEATLAVEMCAFADDVALTIHTHPTLSEGLMESFKHSLKEAIHIMNR